MRVAAYKANHKLDNGSPQELEMFMNLEIGRKEVWSYGAVFSIVLVFVALLDWLMVLLKAESPFGSSLGVPVSRWK